MTLNGRKNGFAPVFDKESKVLILGSFPSVKSRQIDFYYGNAQNRFWRTVCGYFNEEVPPTTEEKRAFLRRRKIALWDMAVSCEIQGSSDTSVKNVEIANLEIVLKNAKIEKILLNGKLAYDLFIRSHADCGIPFKKLSSTSPANPRFDKEEWRKVLDDVFAAT